MAIAVPSVEECTHRWAEACWLAVRDALENPRTQADYDWALGCTARYLRKLTRKANSQAIITFSAALVREAGLKGADRVMVLPLAEGGLFLRRATEEDLMEAHATYTATPRPTFPAKPAVADLPEVEKLCPQCGLTFRTRQERRVYCDGCRRERLRASWGRSWHRRGKLRPSYRRKLKRAGLAGARQARPVESLSLPFGDEMDSRAGATTPAEAFPPSHADPSGCVSGPGPLESAQ
jgi:hypothetical protein